MIQATLALVRASLGRLVRYDIVFKAAGALVFSPLAGLLLDALLARSGSASITNADIAAFALSPSGVAFLVITACLAVAANFAEQAGLLIVLAEPGTRPAFALARVVAALPRLLALAGAVLAWLALAVAPLAAGTWFLHRHYLSEHDINWYLATRPPEWKKALAGAAALALPTLAIVAVLAIRWVFAVPAAIFERRRGFAALRRSAELVRGRGSQIARTLIGWFVVVAAGAALLAVALRFGVRAALTVLPSSAQATGTALLLGLIVVAAFFAWLVAAGGFAALTLRLYSGEAPVPVAAPRGGAGWALLAASAIAAIVVGVVVSRRVGEVLDRGGAVRITAHRGSSRDAPENSLAAIRQAIADGADVCEIDVQEMADGTIVLIHDTDLMRIAKLPRGIGELRYEEVRDLDAGSWFDPKFKDERIPTLEQAIDVSTGKVDLNIELKYHGSEKRLEEHVVEIVRAKGLGQRCVITSLEAKGLRRVRELAPELRIGQIVTVALGEVDEPHVDFLSMNAKQASPAQVRANRSAGLQTHVWTVNDREEMHRMIERGVDNVITDHPAWMREVIAARAKMSDAERLLLALGRKLRE